MRTRLDSRGQVLVIFAAALLAILGLAALGIDVGYLYSARHELQRSADAGALAGASAFFDGDWSEAPVRAVADARARSFASRDRVVDAALDPAGEVAVSYPAQYRIRVDTSRTVNLYFSRLFLGPTMNVTANATAEATVVNRQLPCIMPWGIPYPWEDDNGDDLYTPGEEVHTDCPPGTTDPDYFCQGTRRVLKVGTPGGKKDQPDVASLQQEPGHFFALDFGSGAKTYREMIGERCPGGDPVSVGDLIPLEPGNMVGPTVQGTKSDPDSLLNQDPDSHWNDEHNLPESSEYRIADGTWMNSPRIVRIPVYDPRIPLENGKADMPIAGFAGFWVEDCYKTGLQGTVIGRFLPMNSLGGTLGPDPGPVSGPALMVLRLVE